MLKNEESKAGILATEFKNFKSYEILRLLQC